MYLIVKSFDLLLSHLILPHSLQNRGQHIQLHMSYPHTHCNSYPTSM